MKQQLIFEIDKKDILSSNTYKSLHWAVKGKLTENLRLMSINEGITHHNTENLEGVNNKLDYIKGVNNQNIQKSRRTKALQKEGYDQKEAKALVQKEFENELIVLKEPLPENLFNKFSIKIKVYPPTKRKLDPVNLYPTVKALIDGLTDVSFWEDDDFNHLLEISFRYGGVSGIKDTFKLEFEIEEIDNWEKFLAS